MDLIELVFAHVDNKGKDILIFGTGPTQGLGQHSLTAEKMYSINFTDRRKKCCLDSIIVGQTVIYLLIAQKLLNFKQKILILLQLHYVLEPFQKTGQ